MTHDNAGRCATLSDSDVYNENHNHRESTRSSNTGANEMNDYIPKQVSPISKSPNDNGNLSGEDSNEKINKNLKEECRQLEAEN